VNYQDYIKTELLILVPVLYFVGVGLKKSRLPDKWIPVTLGTVAVLMAAIWVIATSDVSSVKEFAFALFTAITQGVLAAGATVYVHQLYVQANKGE